MTRDALADQIVSVAEISGEFRLRSGRTSTTYFDKYQFEADPLLLTHIAKGLALLIPPGTEVLAGLELGGVPIATALALTSGLPAAFVRKAPKAYGTCKLAEGAAVEGHSVLVVEDVVTTGGQVVESVTELRASGARITDALCVIDREEGGGEALRAIGVHLHSLFRRRDLALAPPSSGS